MAVEPVIAPAVKPVAPVPVKPEAVLVAPVPVVPADHYAVTDDDEYHQEPEPDFADEYYEEPEPEPEPRPRPRPGR